MNYSEITKLFGTPLTQIPVTDQPSKFKSWQIIAGLAVVGLAVYGGYCLYNEFKDKPTLVVRNGGNWQNTAM